MAVARLASLSAAGRVLKLDPATVGRRIARLEAALDVPLFVKTPQGYSLATAGERLLAHGEAAEQAMRAALAAAGSDEVLLFSPSFSSFDEFGNFVERALLFRKLAGFPLKK